MKLRKEEKKNNFIMKTDYNKRLVDPQVAKANLGGPGLQSHDCQNCYGRDLRFCIICQNLPLRRITQTQFNNCFIMHMFELF